MSKSSSDVAEFFTGNANDTRGSIFYKLAMTPADTSFSVQTPRTWEDVRSFMSVANFNEKPSAQYRDEDVHWEIYQFIVDVAKWHRFVNMTTAQIMQKSPRVQQIVRSRTEAPQPQNGGAYLSNPDIKAWYFRTIGKFNEMPMYVKNIYSAFFNMVGPNGQFEIGSPIVQEQLDNYRVNLKKDNDGKIHLFAQALPRIVSSTRVWTSQNKFEQGAVDFFQNLYEDIINGNKTVGGWNKNIATYFRINNDKLVQELLRQSLEIPMPTFEDISNDDDIIINNKYAARDSAHNLIWKKDGVNNLNAKESFNTLTAADKCYTSSISANATECQNFIQRCILSDSDAACQKAFATQKLFSNIDKESIKNIHPYIAYKILQKLQFYGIKQFDKTANRTLVKVIDANTWKQEVAPKISFVKPISQGLIDYLQLLVDYCNSNPAIFNNDYSGETQEAFNYPEIQDPYGLKTPLVDITRSINDTSFVPITSNISRLNQRLKFIVRQPILSRVNPMQFMAGPQLSPQMAPIQFMASSQMSNMMGGGNVIPQYYTAMYAKHSGALALRSVYIRNLERLQRYNKDLSVESKAKIVSLLEELYETEVKVLKYINLIEKYNSLSDLFPNSQEKMFNPKLLDKITQKYETMLQKKERRENTIMDVLETLVKSVKEQTPETLERVSLPNPIANTEF